MMSDEMIIKTADFITSGEREKEEVKRRMGEAASMFSGSIGGVKSFSDEELLFEFDLYWKGGKESDGVFGFLVSEIYLRSLKYEN